MFDDVQILKERKIFQVLLFHQDFWLRIKPFHVDRILDPGQDVALLYATSVCRDAGVIVILTSSSFLIQ